VPTSKASYIKNKFIPTNIVNLAILNPLQHAQVTVKEHFMPWVAELCVEY